MLIHGKVGLVDAVLTLLWFSFWPEKTLPSAEKGGFCGQAIQANEEKLWRLFLAALTWTQTRSAEC